MNRNDQKPRIGTAILLSIRPEHAERIYEGSKHYELRKVIPKTEFRRVYLFETGGAGITGVFDVGRVVELPISDLWERVGTAATTRERFFQYFGGFDNGYAIEIRNPLRFEKPVAPNGHIRLQPPQNFIILEPGQPLFSVLESARARALTAELPGISLKRINPGQRDEYTSLVVKHISANYSDIDQTFPEANLRIHDQEHDPAGFFTRRKEVLAAYNKKETCIGYTTLTYKSGGCVKTGPTILFRRYQQRGYGQAVRRAIEERVRKAGGRKIYCTCPETAEPTVRYLLRAGMRVEGHLARHYSTSHDELVFGKLLTADSIESRAPAFLGMREGSIEDPANFDRDGLVSDFRRMFANTWSEVSDNVARGIIKQAVDEKTREHHKKPKRIVTLRGNGNCIGAVVLLPKRGGAVKGLLLRDTSHAESIATICDAAIQLACKLGGRKLYFLHPLMDSAGLGILRGLSFQCEGLLRAPYVPGQDVVIVSKFL